MVVIEFMALQLRRNINAMKLTLRGYTVWNCRGTYNLKLHTTAVSSRCLPHATSTNRSIPCRNRIRMVRCKCTFGAKQQQYSDHKYAILATQCSNLRYPFDLPSAANVQPGISTRTLHTEVTPSNVDQQRQPCWRE